MSNKEEVERRQQCTNRIESLVLAIDAFTHTVNRDDIRSKDRKESKPYRNMHELILGEDDLFSIFRHPLFKESKDRELHNKIFKIIIQRANDTSIAPAIFDIMTELNQNDNFMTSLAHKFTDTLIWNKTRKQLQSTLPPLSAVSNYQNESMNANAMDPHIYCETDTDEESSSYHYSDDNYMDRLNDPDPPVNDSTDESSSCQHSDDDDLHQNESNNKNNSNKQNRRRNNRRKRRRKSVKNQNKNECRQESIKQKEQESNIRQYSHNFDQFNSDSSSSASVLLDELSKSIPPPPEPKVCAVYYILSFCGAHS